MRKITVILYILGIFSLLAAQEFKIKKGWQLLGTTEMINVETFKNKCVDFVWSYDVTNSWKVYAANGDSFNIPSNINQLTFLEAEKGFWVNGNGSCDIKTDSTSVAPIDLTNKAPLISAPDAVNVSYSGSTDINVEVADPENNPMGISWKVLNSSELNSSLNLIVKNNFKTISVIPSKKGEYQIQVQVTDGTNTSYKNINVSVINFSPEYSEASIYPKKVKSSDNIVFEIKDIKDLDNDFVEVEYYWFKNGTAIDGYTSLDLPSGIAQKGDTISVYAKLTDGENNITTETKSVIIQNTPPNLDNISFNLDNPSTTDDIEVVIDQLYDYDNDQVIISYEWFINGNKVSGENSNLLSSGLAKKGDNVSVSITVSDSIDTITKFSDTIAISDAPLVANFKGLPSQIEYNKTLSFNLEVLDPDGESIDLELAYGPTGMSIEKNGTVTWSPKEIMFLQEEVFNFGFKNSITNEIVGEKSIKVINENKELPLARSGIEVPYRNYSLWVDDFDGDGKNEILSTDSKNLIYTLKFNGTDYKQDWLYPFALPTNRKINQIIGKDITNDGKAEIIIMTGDGVSIIDDISKPAENKFKIDNGEIIASSIDDIDNDKVYEIAMVIENGYSYELHVYQLNDWSLEFTSNLGSEDIDSVLIGNTDKDDALEIITSSGYVYDGISGENEWFFSNGFGKKLAVGDIDNDNIAEIVGTDGWDKPIVYSAVSKSELWEINNDDICTLNIMNIDKDPQNEILVGNCQWGDVTAYDGSTGSAVKDASWDTIEHASISVTAGDVDNDNEIEVIWGSGITSTGEDVLVVADIYPTVNISWYNDNPSQLDYFAAAGWAAVTPENEQAIFLAPQTDSGYNGQRVVTMNTEGVLNISDEIATNWDDAKYIKAIDYDNDGYGEIFLATAKLYDGEFQVRQINDMSLEWGGLGGDYENNIKAVDGSDMNGDGYEDAIFIDSGSVNIFDIYNQESLWTSVSLGTVYDIEALDEVGQASKLIIAAKNDLAIWKKSGNNYIREVSNDLSCQRVQIVSNTIDNSFKVVCLEYSSSEKSTFHILDTNLNLNNSFTMEGNSEEFIVQDQNGTSENLYVVTSLETGTYYSSLPKSNISLVSLEGDLIWKSPELLGQIPHRSLHTFSIDGINKSFTFATKDAMYITK